MNERAVAHLTAQRNSAMDALAVAHARVEEMAQQLAACAKRIKELEAAAPAPEAPAAQATLG